MGLGIVGVGVVGNRLQLLLARIQSVLIPMDFEFVDVCQLPGLGIGEASRNTRARGIVGIRVINRRGLDGRA
jgi:hypothetical protein